MVSDLRFCRLSIAASNVLWKPHIQHHFGPVVPQLFLAQRGGTLAGLDLYKAMLRTTAMWASEWHNFSHLQGQAAILPYTEELRFPVATVPLPSGFQEGVSQASTKEDVRKNWQLLYEMSDVFLKRSYCDLLVTRGMAHPPFGRMKVLGAIHLLRLNSDNYKAVQAGHLQAYALATTPMISVHIRELTPDGNEMNGGAVISLTFPHSGPFSLLDLHLEQLAWIQLCYFNHSRSRRSETQTVSR